MKTPRHIAIASAARRAVIQMEQAVRIVNDNDFNFALRDLRSAIELPQEKTPKLHVLVIDNDSGLTSSIYSSKAAATRALYTYVGENWGEMNTPHVPTKMQEAIDEYFNRDESDDRAEISACEVES